MKFNTDGNVTVAGRLSAIGRADAPIVFTSQHDDTWGGDLDVNGYGSLPSRGDWGQVYLTSTSADGVLEHAVIRYGGRSGPMFDVRGTFALANVRLDNGGQDAIITRNVDVTLDDCEMSGNGRHGLYATGAGTVTVDGGLSDVNYFCRVATITSAAQAPT